MNRMKIYDKSNIYSLKQLSPVPDTQLYLYVILNSENRIKIGRTTNPLNRIISLSGSNTGGAKICKIACTEQSTYVLTLENALHSHYNYYRVKGTEWFERLDFDEVVEYINSLLSKPTFEMCENIRKERLKLNNDNDNENLSKI